MGKRKRTERPITAQNEKHNQAHKLPIQVILEARFVNTLDTMSDSQRQTFNEYYNQLMGVVLDRLQSIVELDGYKVL